MAYSEGIKSLLKVSDLHAPGQSSGACNCFSRKGECYLQFSLPLLFALFTKLVEGELRSQPYQLPSSRAG